MNSKEKIEFEKWRFSSKEEVRIADASYFFGCNSSDLETLNLNRKLKEINSFLGLQGELKTLI